MSLRFKVLSTVFVMLLLVATNSDMRLFGSVMDVFAGIALLLVLALIMLFPSSSQPDRVDRSIEGSSWADRIDIEKAGRQARGGE
jgi:hypothetical protein